MRALGWGRLSTCAPSNHLGPTPCSFRTKQTFKDGDSLEGQRRHVHRCFGAIKMYFNNIFQQSFSSMFFINVFHNFVIYCDFHPSFSSMFFINVFHQCFSSLFFITVFHHCHNEKQAKYKSNTVRCARTKILLPCCYLRRLPVGLHRCV